MWNLGTDVSRAGQCQVVNAAMLGVERGPGRHAMAGSPYLPLIPWKYKNLLASHAAWPDALPMLGRLLLAVVLISIGVSLDLLGLFLLLPVGANWPASWPGGALLAAFLVGGTAAVAMGMGMLKKGSGATRGR